MTEQSSIPVEAQAVPNGWLVHKDGKWFYEHNTLYEVDAPKNVTIRLPLFAAAQLVAASPAAAANQQPSALSEFVRNATPDRKEEVYGNVMERVAESQQATIDAAAVMSALAECRDMFPIPAPGGPLEQLWAQAMGDPTYVPAYVLACLQEGAAAAAGVPTGYALVPREAPLALLKQLTGYDSVGWMEREHDRNTILERLRTRWAAILEVAASPVAPAGAPTRQPSVHLAGGDAGQDFRGGCALPAVTDEAVIAMCARVGIRWTEPMYGYSGTFSSASIEQVRRLLGSAAAPEGWRLVPVEPTDAMVDADWDVSMSEAHSNGGVSTAAWRAMLEAAPQASYGHGHSGLGWYAHDTEYPEEGAMFLGEQSGDGKSC